MLEEASRQAWASLQVDLPFLPQPPKMGVLPGEAAAAPGLGRVFSFVFQFPALEMKESEAL